MNGQDWDNTIDHRGVGSAVSFHGFVYDLRGRGSPQTDTRKAFVVVESRGSQLDSATYLGEDD